MANKFKWRGKELKAVVEKEGLAAIRTMAERILTVAATTEAPVDTGTLRRSGTVTVGKLPDPNAVYDAAKAGRVMKDAFPGIVGGERVVYISFNTPYARRQHEELDWIHPRGGKAKYLEDPFNRMKDKLWKFVEARIRKKLKATK